MDRFDLMPGEHIVLTSKIHWKNHIFPTLMLAATIAAAGAVEVCRQRQMLTLLTGWHMPANVERALMLCVWAMITFAILRLAVSMLNNVFTRYYVTDRRIIAVRGFLNITIREMDLDRCETVTLTQNLYERLFNTGDVTAVSAGASIYMDDVRNAMQFRMTVVEMMTIRREKTGRRNMPAREDRP
jgi:uncharacterized membrane protein YdbT with pleckstrin-like domain